MRSLVLAPETPLPATSGGRLRTLHLARALTGVADVDVAALGLVPEARGEPFSLTGIPHRRFRAASGMTALRRPYLAAKFESGPMARLASEARWHTVQAEFPFLVPAAQRARTPVVLDAHNVEHEIARMLSRSDSRVLHRLRWAWEARKTERFEGTVAAQVSAVCVTSEADAEAFEAWGAREVVIVRNGVDTARVPWRTPSQASGLLYVGHFGYRPNAEAALELVNEILPRVRERVPGASVRLVGRDAGRQLLERTSEAIEVAGEVPDVVPHLHGRRALVVPLRSGSGTRLKVLEAMAAGVPVVSTPLGVAGLRVRDGEHVLIAESAPDLAALAVRVIEDDALATSLSRAGRRLVERAYDWAVVARPLLELHVRLSGR